MSQDNFDANLNNEEFLKALFNDLDKIDAEVNGGLEALGALAGGGVGAAGAFAALYYLGAVGLSGPGIMSALAAAGLLVGGGAAAGVGVLAAPVAFLAVSGYAIMSRRKNARIRLLQNDVLQKAIGKQNAIIQRLDERASLSGEVVTELEARLAVLRQVVTSLQTKLNG